MNCRRECSARTIPQFKDISRSISLAALWLGLIMAGCSAPPQAVSTMKAGAIAPGFSLEAVRGGSYSLENLRGQIVLLSFLNTQAKAASADTEASRSQIVSLKSMQEQYGSKGLRVLIVDAAKEQTAQSPTRSDLINFTYDWRLDSIPVLADEKGDTANVFGVSSLPSTFLIGADGVIQQRWDGMASSAQIALSIEALANAPVGNTASAGQPTACPGGPLPQAKFAGVGLAKSLSSQIWVVDNAQSWGVGNNFPLQWIVLDDSNKFGSDGVHLRVTAGYQTLDSTMLIDQPLAVLSSAEASGLLNAPDTNVQKMAFLTTTIVLKSPGCLHLEAQVTDQATGAALYTGQMVVSAK
ncbi:MAG TPA: redoxin domain-containing protein [Aggregatilineales bacterium]|nr:redoxin domain-containing protein [Aggregatilineales bacterium]